MKRLLGTLAALCLLVGCGPKPGGERASAPVPAAGDSVAQVPADTTGRGDPWEVVRAYYAAIDARDFAAAYALWGRDGAASGKTYGEFADGFRDMLHAGVEPAGPITTEGAAGSLYATVPVLIRASTQQGVEQRFAGSYTLRRVNDVPGATPAQLRWHLDSAQLSAAHPE